MRIDINDMVQSNKGLGTPLATFVYSVYFTIFKFSSQGYNRLSWVGQMYNEILISVD